MAKAILISIQSPHACNILNLIKLWEIRKKFPKDYVGWVYIYVTKGGETLWRHNNLNTYGELSKDVEKQFCAYGKNRKELDDKLLDFLYKNGIRVGISRGVHATLLNGKVVARFWCDKVKGAYNFYVEELCQLACINKEELYKYAGGWYKTDDLLAIHINDLEIFDRPKEIGDFSVRYPKGDVKFNNIKGKMLAWKPLTRAPQSWCYVEV